MKLILTIFILSISFYSHAQFTAAPAAATGTSKYILDPYVAYEKGYLTQRRVPEMTVSGTNYGVRLGMNLWGIGMGLDYMMASMTAEQSDQTGDFKPTDYGLFLSFKLMGYKIYSTYFLSSNAKIQSEENSQNFSGGGYKIGLGWKMYPMLDASFELINREYDKYGSEKLNNSILSSTASFTLAIPIL